MKVCYFFLIVMLCFPAASTPTSVRMVIPGPSAPFTVRNPFVEQLLVMVFAKQNITLELVYAAENITQGRALKELNNHDALDLTWSVTTKERERSLIPIRIPLYQGFIGWRVFVINKNNQEKFSDIDNVEQLSQLLAIQRFDWPDYQIFIENNLTVDGSLPFSQMYKAIENGLADYFPRSVLEVTRELKALNSNQLVVERSLLLKYPSSYYFFVGKNNTELAECIEKGFEIALADGSYQLLFQQHFGQALEALNINDRKVIHLSSSLLPVNSSLANERQ